MKARKKSTVCTIALPGGTRTTAASSGACRPISTSSRSIGRSAASARESTVAPTLAPQPPQRMAIAEIACAASSPSSATGAARRRRPAPAIGRQLAELAHEAAVDPVLPAPDPGALQRKAAPREAIGVPVAGADQRQPAPLRAVGAQRLARDARRRLSRQRRAHAHGEHAGLLQRMARSSRRCRRRRKSAGRSRFAACR